jgi:ParB-like chromosome segregation protein Spo0J
MNAFVRPEQHVWAHLDAIEIPETARAYNASAVVEIKRSIEAIGLQTPLTVIEREGRFTLIAGRHRLEALRLLNAEKAPCRVVDMSDVEARMWTLSENLHRAELTVTQRAQQIAEWIRLAEDRQSVVSAQVAPKVAHGRPESGINLAARELGIERTEAQRAVKIDSIAPAAKEALRAAKLDDNQTVALKVASAPAETQVAAVERIVQARAQPAAGPVERGEVASLPTAKPLRDLVGISGGELARWVKLSTPNDRPHVIRVLEMAAAILRDELDEPVPAIREVFP